jgi:protein-histidine pros-kinase
MGLQTKFNLTMLSAFLIGLALTALLSQRILQQNAYHEVLQNARIMIESAAAVRSYTAREIHPLLIDQIEQKFLPQTVSAYAATQNFKALQEKLPAFSYKEAALNPTNPNDRALDWEADVIQAFRKDSAREELVVQRDTPLGPMLHLARPLRVQFEGCLTCHCQPDRAP